MPQGPDLEALLRKAQDTVKRLLPGGTGGGRVLGLIAAALVGIWLLSGFYRVQPDELGVVLRFGKFVRVAQPGLNYALPAPIESVLTPRVTRINRIDIGFRGAGETPRAVARDVVEESLMLTGDENIIDIDFAVFWRIRDVDQFLFNIRNPEQTVKSAAESTMREVIGKTAIQPALTEARGQIEQEVRRLTQAMVDQYGAGIEIAQVQLMKVDPPAAVIEAVRDVQRANADRERTRNEAESFRNDIIPRARGEAERVVQEAEAFREAQVARATGESQRFTSVLSAYSQAQDVTKLRMYLETIEEVLQRNPVILVDERVQGLVPFLNVPSTPRSAPPPAGSPGQASLPGIGAAAPRGGLTGASR